MQPGDVGQAADDDEQHRGGRVEAHVQQQPGRDAVDVDGHALPLVEQPPDLTHAGQMRAVPAQLVGELHQRAHTRIDTLVVGGLAVGARLALVEAVAVAPDPLARGRVALDELRGRLTGAVKLDQLPHRPLESAEVVGAQRTGDEADGAGGKGCAHARSNPRPVRRGRRHPVLAE